MTFNVWQEGASVSNGLDKISNVIVEVNPDILCFTEVKNYNDEDWTTKIVNKLAAKGKKYYKNYAGGDVALVQFPRFIYKNLSHLREF